MIAEVIIRRSGGRGSPSTLYVVWGRMGPGAWEMMGTYASDLAAREAANAALETLQDIADKVRWSMLSMPTTVGLVDAAFATRPADDARGKCLPHLEEEQEIQIERQKGIAPRQSGEAQAA